MRSRGHNSGCDDTRCDSGKHIVAVHFTPLVSARRRLQVVRPIVNWRASAPVFFLDLRAFPPLVMANIVVVISMIVAMILRVSTYYG
jgi:hypothetical protein